MNKIKCIDQGKFTSIQVGEEYVYDFMEDDFYFLNIEDKKLKYHKKYFKKIINEEDKIKNYIENLKKEILTLRSEKRTNYINDFNNNLTFYIRNCFRQRGSSISCGVAQIYGLNGAYEGIYYTVMHRCAFPESFTKENKEELANELYMFYFEELVIKKYEKYTGQLILSTNIDNNSFFKDIEICIEKILESCEYTSLKAYNPNSKNNIKTWLINT